MAIIGFLERYRANKDWDSIEKSHKYIRRFPKKSGKGWNYVYNDSWKHPFKALLEVFGIKRDRIDEDYSKHNISKDYGADKQTFAAHVLEYFTHKMKRDSLFSKKDKRDKYKKPVKQSEVKERAAAEKVEKKPSESMIVNRSLMSTHMQEKVIMKMLLS